MLKPVEAILSIATIHLLFSVLIFSYSSKRFVDLTSPFRKIAFVPKFINFSVNLGDTNTILFTSIASSFFLLGVTL